jgi:hypothetical protein
MVNILGELLQVWMDNRLTPSQAARLFGKLDFLNQTLFGKVGRTGLLPIKKRQYEASGNHGLTFELKAAISWLVELLVTCPPREISLHDAGKPPLLLYTDGSSNPNRDPMHVVGAVLFIPGQEKPLYTACPVPDEVVSQWIPAKQQIHLVELFAGPVALDTFRPYLFDQRVIHFVDNSSALGALVKGYSNNSDCVRLVADYWLRTAALRATAYIDRVESKSNISDEPSRLCYDELMAQLGAVFLPPVLESLKKGPSQRDPSLWFGGVDRWKKLRDSLLLTC